MELGRPLGQDLMRGFAEFEGYLFDLDGCLYRGNDPVPGARDLLEALRASGKRVGFLSNNSTQDAAEVASKLGDLGIQARARDVWVPTDQAGRFLRETYGQVSVYPLGSPRLLAAIVAEGLRIVGPDEASCDVVFVARDVEFSFDKLLAATRFLQGGARLAAANPDSYHPGASGLRVPETGALVASIVEVTGQSVRTLGKPDPYLFRKALAGLGLGADRVVMVGDNPATDIDGARNAGLSSIWINPEGRAVPPGTAPDRICRELIELLTDLKAAQGGQA